MDQDFPDGDFPGGSPTELQRRVAEGAEPRTILEELWQTMQARLYGYGCKRLGDTSQADDFVQKVFLKMQVNFARMIAREPVEAWIFTVARNEIADWYRERVKSDVPAEAEILDRDSAGESWNIPFEEQIETRIGDIRPLYAYLRAILARGWLRDDDLRAYWQGTLTRSGDATKGDLKEAQELLAEARDELRAAQWKPSAEPQSCTTRATLCKPSASNQPLR